MLWKDRRYFDWNEDLMFESTGKSKLMTSQLARKPEVFFIGRLTFQKGVDRILSLARKNPLTTFNVYGDGPLLKYLRRKKYANLHVHGFHPNPFKEVLSNDIIIIPSRYFEGVPLVLLEALRRDIRVISSGIGDLVLVQANSHFRPKKNLGFLEFADTLIKKIASSDI